MSRQGIMVVSGIVKEASFQKGEVVIENDILLPVSRVITRKRIRFSIDRNYIRSMNLESKLGSFILATIRPTPGLAMYADGCEDPAMEYQAKGFNMRFSGSFDFDPRGEEKESHVFCAPIKRMEHKIISGKSFVFFDIAWKRSGLVVESGEPNSYRGMKRGVFVTGKLQTTSLGPVYKVQSMDLQD